MSLIDYTRLVNRIIVANRECLPEDAESIKEQVRELYSSFSPEDAKKADSIVKSLTLYHNQ